MNNIWKKYKDRVSPYEFDEMVRVTDTEWAKLESIFDEKINNYFNFIEGRMDLPNDGRPIIVHGTRIQLIKVKGFFYLKMHNLPRYTVFTINQITSLQQDNDNENPSFTDCPGLAILYLDANMNDYGKLEKWNDSCILSKVTERSRKENLTLILSEISLEARIVNQKDFHYVNLQDSKYLGVSEESNVPTCVRTWED